MAYSIIRLETLPLNDFFKLNENQTRAIHPWRLRLPNYHHNVRKNDFTCKIPEILNSLNYNTASAKNIKQFLTNLKLENLSGYFRGPI